MDTVLQLALRNTLRNSRRTALTGITVTLGCALLTIGLSWVLGIQGSFIDASIRANGHVRLVSAAYAQREALQPLYENMPQTDPIVAQLLEVEGVEAVYPRLQLGVAASTGDDVGEVFGLVVGAPLAYYDDILGLDDRVTAGRFFEPDADGGLGAQALIGRVLAKNMGVTAGDEAIFIGQTQDGSISPLKVAVVGVVDTGNGLFDKQVFVSLDQARYMADIPEGAVELLVFGRLSREAGAIAGRLEPLCGPLARAGSVVNVAGEPVDLVVSTWDTREPFASLLRTARIIMATIAAVIVFITALGVLNTMLMSVLERTAEVGVLRAMGMKVRGVVGMFVLEAVIISVIGGAVGVTLGSLVSLLMEATGVDLGTIASNLPETIPANRVLHPNWSPILALVSFVLALVMALIGSASPALRAARIPPVAAMRTRR